MIYHHPELTRFFRVAEIIIMLLCALSCARQTHAQATPTPASTPTPAPTATPTPPPVVMTVNEVTAVNPDNPKEVGLRGQVRIVIAQLGRAMQQNKVDPSQFILFLNGRPIQGLTGILVNPALNQVEFKLQRTTASKDVWDDLLGSPTQRIVPVRVGVGPDAQHEFPAATNQAGKSADNMLQLVIFNPFWLLVGLIFFVLAIGLFYYLAKAKAIIRDVYPPEPAAGTQRPYSLARFQASFWFFLIIGSFVFIYLITGEYNTLTTQALMLIGIGTGTALGAAMIDISKQQSADSDLTTLLPQKASLEPQIKELEREVAAYEAMLPPTPPPVPAVQPSATDLMNLKNWGDAKAQLATAEAQLAALKQKIDAAEAKKSKPVSEGFFDDVLTDANGINFHRFQMLSWTFVMGFLFVQGVYRNLAMPEFDGTLLALMGISAGTYLGFKIPEVHQ